MEAFSRQEVDDWYIECWIPDKKCNDNDSDDEDDRLTSHKQINEERNIKSQKKKMHGRKQL